MGVIIPQVVTEDRAGGAQIIDGGLRFNYGKNNHLKKTFSAGNQTTWTWSAWIKLSGVLDEHILSVGSTSADRTGFEIPVSGGIPRFSFYNIASSSVNMLLTTSAVPRDCSGFYHIVIVADTTSATSTERLRMYINGVRVTDFSSATYPNQNTTTFLNSAVIGSIGNRAYNLTDNPFDGQLSQVYLIDGQALDASYFGYTDSLTNTWRPKKYTGNFNYSAPTGTLTSTQTALPTYSNQGGGSQNSSYPVSNGFDGSASTYCDMTYLNGQWSKLTFGTAITGVTSLVVGYDGEGDVGYNGSVVNSSVGFNGSRQTITLYSGSAITLTDLYFVSQAGNGVCRLYDVTINGVEQTFVAGTGTNSFYLPFDGNSPIGQDRSGRGNNWTPVNFGGSNTIEKATGAFPILNTDGGGKVARVGVRTDSNASSLVLALPLVGIKSDFSNAINSGVSNKTVTVTGNAAASSARSNFYGGSFVFDGSGDYLDTGYSVNSAFAQGDYTIEFWFYSNDDQSEKGLFGMLGGQYGISMRHFGSYSAGGNRTISAYFGSSTPKVELTNRVQDRWVHVAMVKSGTTGTLYVDGVNQGTVSTGSPTVSTTNLCVGTYYDTTSGYSFNGYIQDFRVYTSAKYTQNFIPASTDPDILPDTPSGVAYSSNVALVPSADGAVTFDGTGDWLSLPTSSDFSCSSGTNFTFEAFIYPTSVSDTTPFGIGNNAGFAYRIVSGSPYLYVAATGGILNTGAIVANKWTHIAVTRNSGTLYSFIDGVLVGSVANSGSFDGTQQNFIGAANLTGAGSPGYTFTGQISNAHWVNGTALYTSNFTPPTAPITSVANTKLLCCKSNSSATAFDVSPGSIAANGNAAATNFNPFTVNINTQRGKQSGYATLNPTIGATQLGGSTAPTYSDGNSKVSFNGAAFAAGTIGVSSGKWYFEVLVNSAASTNNSTGFGIRNGLNAGAYTDFTGYFRGVRHNNSGNITYSTSGDTGTSAGAIMAPGEVYGIIYDVDNNYFALYKNGVILASSSSSSLSGGTWFPYAFGDSASGSHTFNFGQKPFKFPPPAGFQPLALANTPRPTIVRPDQYVGVTTYTGNGGTQSINVGWKPDFVWIKQRSSPSRNHVLYDTVRGATKALLSSTTDSEQTYSTSLSSFDSNGFTLGSDDKSNGSTLNYVGWAWKAGGNSNTYNINDVGYATASAAGLTAGTITPSGASINTKAGFSIIKYSHTINSPRSIPHGLTQTPEFMIAKYLDGTTNWNVYHASATGPGGGPQTGRLMLNATNAYSDEIDVWNDTAPTNQVWTVGGATWQGVGNHITYLWHSVPGFSKFGSYSGNSSNDGPVVVTGFKPRWIMIKSSTSAYGWYIYDTSRDPYNISGKELLANEASSEVSDGDIDILSNGFKLRRSSLAFNNSSNTFVYAAFAETPNFNLYGGQSNAR